jgi:EmrB/QacA subfamily drug resistance transporter
MRTEADVPELAAEPAGEPSSRSRPVALAAILVVLFLTFLDNTVVSVTLPQVQDDLHAGVTELQWIIDGYALAFAGLMLVGGSVGDLLGRRRVMLVGVAVFCAGSVLSALATSGTSLIVGRVVMGVGAAASEPGTLSMIRQLFPGHRARSRALGAWAAVSGLALALGPVVGAGLVALGSWRTVFWFNLVLGVFALGAVAVALPESADREGRRIDVPGAVLGAAALSCVTFAIIEGEIKGYRSSPMLALFVVAIVALLLFLVVEHRTSDPLIDISFFRRPTFAGANAVAFLVYFGLFGIFFFTALYLQLVVGLSASALARQFAPMAAGMVLASLLTGRWVARAGARLPMALGCLVAAAGVLWTDSLLSRTVSETSLALALTTAGVGFGMALVPVTSAALDAVPARLSGMAASVTNTSRQMGAVLGVAVLGSVVNAQLTGSLQHRLVAMGTPPQLRAYVQNAVTHGGIPKSGLNNLPPQLQALVDRLLDAAYASFGDAIHWCLTVSAALLVLATVVAIVLIRPRVQDADEETPYVEAPASERNNSVAVRTR